MVDAVRCEKGIVLCRSEFAAAQKADLRGEPRVPLTRRAWLSSARGWLPCLIENMSTQGFLIMSNDALAVGAVMELKCELYPERILQCSIEVTHVTDSCMGTKIVQISGYAANLCREFITEHYSLSKPVKVSEDSSDVESEAD